MVLRSFILMFFGLPLFRIISSYQNFHSICLHLNYMMLCLSQTGRVDNVYGDRHLVCTLLPASHVVEEQAAATA